MILVSPHPRHCRAMVGPHVCSAVVVRLRLFGWRRRRHGRRHGHRRNLSDRRDHQHRWQQPVDGRHDGSRWHHRDRWTRHGRRHRHRRRGDRRNHRHGRHHGQRRRERKRRDDDRWKWRAGNRRCRRLRRRDRRHRRPGSGWRLERDLPGQLAAEGRRQHGDHHVGRRLTHVHRPRPHQLQRQHARPGHPRLPSAGRQRQPARGLVGLERSVRQRRVHRRLPRFVQVEGQRQLVERRLLLHERPEESGRRCPVRARHDQVARRRTPASIRSASTPAAARTAAA